MNNFSPADHPRRPDGRFATKVHGPSDVTDLNDTSGVFEIPANEYAGVAEYINEVDPDDFGVSVGVDEETDMPLVVLHWLEGGTQVGERVIPQGCYLSTIRDANGDVEKAVLVREEDVNGVFNTMIDEADESLRTWSSPERVPAPPVDRSRLDLFSIGVAAYEAKRTGRPVRIDHPDGNRYDDGELGSSCGDFSVGVEPSVSATWATGDEDEPFITVTSTRFVTASDYNNGSKNLNFDALQDALVANSDAERANREKPHAIEFAIENMVEWTAHTDPNDPGSSEVRSDIRYVAEPRRFMTQYGAEAEARYKSKHTTFDGYDPSLWE